MPVPVIISHWQPPVLTSYVAGYHSDDTSSTGKQHSHPHGTFIEGRFSSAAIMAANDEMTMLSTLWCNSQDDHIPGFKQTGTDCTQYALLHVC